jgi:hypothetical protein
MAIFTWYLQGTSPTTLPDGDTLLFSGASFGDAITVGSYNDSTQVLDSDGTTDNSAANTPVNNKFISQAGGTEGDSQIDVGAGTVDLDTILDGDCALKINFAHATAVALTNVDFFAYDGTTPATGPTGVDFRCAESGDINFTEAEGSGSKLSLDDSASSTSHDFYIACSASPTSVGEKTDFKVRLELTYT